MRDNVLILGNSITYHAPSAALGWNGSWGMAASAPDKDYVHIIGRRLASAVKTGQITALNISKFENEYWHYDFQELNSQIIYTPDIAIIRIGENVNKNEAAQHDFTTHYKSLINFLKTKNPEIKILCVPGFWKNPDIEILIKQCAVETGVDYLEISSLDQPQFTAWGLFSNNAVASHPGDKGMIAIADLIWPKIETYLIPYYN